MALSPLLGPGAGPTGPRRNHRSRGTLRRRRNARRRRAVRGARAHARTGGLLASAHGRLVAALGVPVALAAAAIVLSTGTLSLGSSHDVSARHASARRGASLAGLGGNLAATQGPPRSPAGMPLAKPAFTLAGLGQPAAGVVRPGFAHPPRAGLLFNLDTGQVLWRLHPEQRVPIASLTKMMTALLAVHATRPGTPVRISRQAVNTPGSKVGLLPLGRRVPAEALLYGLLLPSGNDAAVALAQQVGGSVGRFVAQMNAEAARLGLGCTRFSNPSGYFERDNFSCAADLAVLAAVDLREPRIARVVRAPRAAVRFPIKGGKLFLTNNNPLLLYGYRGADGVKTGYTEAAGTCLVASAERGGVRLGVVLLHSPAPGTQAQTLFNDAFGGVYHERIPPEATIPGGA